MIYLNARCRNAEQRIAQFVENLAEEHLFEMGTEFIRAYGRAGLTPMEIMKAKRSAYHRELNAHYRHMVDELVYSNPLL